MAVAAEPKTAYPRSLLIGATFAAAGGVVPLLRARFAVQQAFDLGWRQSLAVQEQRMQPLELRLPVLPGGTVRLARVG